MDASLEHVAELGFNTVLLWKHGMETEEIRKALDLAHKHGIRVHLYWRNFDFVYGKYRALHKQLGEKRRYGRYWKDHFQEVYDRMARVVPQVKDHPALFGYHVLDEPGNVREARYMLRELKRMIKEIDPYHPVWLSFCRVIQILPDRRYDEFYDFTGAHLYPATTRDGAGSINKIGWWARKAAYAARDLHIPLVMTTQSGIAGMCVRERTADEFRMQVYLSIVNGMKGGIGYFKYGFASGPVHMKGWQEVAQLNKEAEELLPIISELDPKQTVLTPTGSCIHALLKVHRGKVYLLLANGHVLSQELRFKCNFVGSRTRVRRLFKGGRIECAASGFTDAVRFHDSRVYEISRWKLPPGEEAFEVEISAKELPEKRTPETVREFAASGSGAYYWAGQRAICVYGKGNTLASVARDVGDKKIFSYDRKARKATASIFANVIRIAYGGELVIGDDEDPSKGETLEFARWPDDLEGKGSWRSGINNNGYLKVANSRLIGNGRAAVSPAYIGMVEVINSSIDGFTHFRKRKDAKTGKMTASHFSHLLEEAEFSEDGRVTVSYYGAAADGRKRYSKGLRGIIDWSIDDRQGGTNDERNRR